MANYTRQQRCNVLVQTAHNALALSKLIDSRYSEDAHEVLFTAYDKQVERLQQLIAQVTKERDDHIEINDMTLKLIIAIANNYAPDAR